MRQENQIPHQAAIGGTPCLWNEKDTTLAFDDPCQFETSQRPVAPKLTLVEDALGHSELNERENVLYHFGSSTVYNCGWIRKSTNPLRQSKSVRRAGVGCAVWVDRGVIGIIGFLAFGDVLEPLSLAPVPRHRRAGGRHCSRLGLRKFACLRWSLS